MRQEEAPVSGPTKATINKAAVVLVLFVYISSYIVLSRMGRYEPIPVRGSPVDEWQWSPGGYPGNWKLGKFEELHTPLTWQRVFMPLLSLDRQIWHTEDKLGRPGYPIKFWDDKEAPPGWRIVTPR
jgi:hypothetical protein